MSTRVYPTNALRGGSATLTGSGNVADIFTFPYPCQIVVQNDTAATIYVAVGGGTGAAATQGDEAVPAGAEFGSTDLSSWVAIYGVASTHVNGTTSAGLVVYGEI